MNFHELTVTCCDCTSLIKLPNHCVAVSSGKSSKIHVIETEYYQLIKVIECKDYIVSDGYNYSSLHLLNNGTFIYSHRGCFCQISSMTYKVIFKYKRKNEFEGSVTISSSNGKYIIVDNWSYGLSIYKVNYI